MQNSRARKLWADANKMYNNHFQFIELVSSSRRIEYSNSIELVDSIKYLKLTYLERTAYRPVTNTRELAQRASAHAWDRDFKSCALWERPITLELRHFCGLNDRYFLQYGW